MRRVGLIGVIAVLLASFPVQAQEMNVLVNGGLEEGAYGPYLGKGRSDLNVPAGWSIWLAQGDTSQYYNRGDEVRAYPHTAPGPNPVEGTYSANVHGGYIHFTAALYQSVLNVNAGSRVRAEAAAWVHACTTEDNEPGQCASDPASGARTRIGIDPMGGTDANAPSIVWSVWITPHDIWGRQAVEATAASDRVTVFLYATQDSPQMHNFVYWDDARMTFVGERTEAPPGSSISPVTSPLVIPVTPITEDILPTPLPPGFMPPTPLPAATAFAPPPVPVQPFASFVVPQAPEEDGSIVHTVKAGETFDAIAYAYGMTRDDLLALNPEFGSIRFIFAGQEILIREAP